MESKKSWRNKSSLREKYALISLLGKTPMEVADPIAYSNCFPQKTPAKEDHKD